MEGEDCIIQVHEGVTEGGESSVMAVARDWFRQTNDEVRELGQTRSNALERWRAASIYRIPRNLKKLNSRAYQPQVVSIGPYHHGEAQLAAMEEHKHRAFLNFLERTGKPLERYAKALAPEMQKLKDAYPQLQPQYRNQGCCKFLKMMIIDGCFILELMWWTLRSRPDVENDPIFSEHGVLYLHPLLKRDMLMLENQIPLIVLVKLRMEAEGRDEKTNKAELRRKIVKFFDPPTRDQNLKDKSKSLDFQIEKWGDCFLHILDLYGKSLLLFDKHKSSSTSYGCLRSCCSGMKSKGIDGDNGRVRAVRTKAKGMDDDGWKKLRWPGFCFGHEKHSTGMRAATELAEAGIGFEKSETGYLNDIGLGSRNSVKLPGVTVDATSEFNYLNLMAFERLHVGGAGNKPMNDVTSYVFIMDRLIDTPKDVALLHKHGIIESMLGSDDAVAAMFNRLSADICPDYDAFMLKNMVAEKYQKPVPRCLAYARQNYFTNPWVTITIVVGVIIFLLTMAQTVYAVLDYHTKE